MVAVHFPTTSDSASPPQRRNNVKTARYSVYNFLPLNLIEQLSQLNNLFFFSIGILQMIPQFSVTGGLPVMWLPLSQVMLVVGVLEGYADYKRHQSDRLENTQLTHKFDRGGGVSRLKKCAWEDLSTGDLVICSNRETSPADLLLLASSRDDAKAMVETSSLDGETNLKFKSVPPRLVSEGLADFERVQQLEGTVHCDAGVCHLDNRVAFPFSGDNMLLRGCKLRNTEWVVGLVVHAGHDTQIYQGASDAATKTSRLELKTQRLLSVSFGILIFVCSAYSMAAVVMDWRKDRRFMPFIPPSRGLLRRFGARFVSWVLLLVNMIPISLFFFLNISRTIQGLVMQRSSDKLRDVRAGQSGERLTVRNNRANADLGCVKYLFTDKTGTLTCNYMEFKKICIGGVSYGEESGAAAADVAKKAVTPHVSINDPRLDRLIAAGDADTYDMLLHMAINHSVFIETEEDGAPATGIFSASSADEGALVYAASHLGFVLTAQEGCRVAVTLPAQGRLLEVKILCRIDFDSERKRSSVLAQFDSCDEDPGRTPPLTETRRTVLYVKGADSVIRSRLSPESAATSAATFRHVAAYAEKGLRTLCMARRDIAENFLDDWLPRYNDATVATSTDIESVTTLKTLIDEMERDLVLQGAVGVEDKLAEEVPETIARLKEAGIKVAMLTGDKLETAVNIGLHTGIIGRDAQIVKLDDAQDATAKVRVLSACEEAQDNINLVIEGSAIPELSLFSKALLKVGGVVICRATPQQKAEVVRAVMTEQSDSDAVVVAVGDGGNDCQMIQTADVGIGIKGAEGLQAFNVSDYGITGFSDLQELILVHGRWNFRRLNRLVFYTLTKMLVMNGPQVVAGLYSLSTPQRIFAESINQFVNPVFSSLAPIIFASIDADTEGEVLLAHPALYRADHHDFTFNRYIEYVLNAVLLHAAIAGLLPAMITGSTFHNKDGQTPDLWSTGTISFFCALFLMTQKLNLECYSSLPVTFIVNITSAMTFFAPLAVLRGLREPLVFILHSMPIFLMIWALTFFLAIFRDYFWKCYKRLHAPTLVHKMQHEQRSPKGMPRILSALLPILKHTEDDFHLICPPDTSVTRRLQELVRRKHPDGEKFV